MIISQQTASVSSERWQPSNLTGDIIKKMLSHVYNSDGFALLIVLNKSDAAFSHVVELNRQLSHT